MKNYFEERFREKLDKHLIKLTWDKPEDIKNDLINKIMEDCKNEH